MNPARRMYKLGAAVAALLGVELVTADDRRRAAFVASLVIDLAAHERIGIPDDARSVAIQALAISDELYAETEDAMIAAYLEEDPSAAAASSAEGDAGPEPGAVDAPAPDVIGDADAVRIVEQAIASGRAAQPFPSSPAGSA